MGIHSTEKHQYTILFVCKSCWDMEAIQPANTFNSNAYCGERQKKMAPVDL